MQLGTLELNTIHTGDARELSLQIPDNSIDLVFTDPVYDRIEDYIWLAQTAKRILKPAGAILVWSNGKWHRKNADWLEDAGLVYRWDFSVINGDTSAPLHGKIISKANRVLWFDTDGESKLRGHLPDGYYSIGGRRLIPFLKSSWSKSVAFTIKAIDAFTEPGEIVADFFSGSATTACVCKKLGRAFLAFEIDPTKAEASRQRLTQTMPPMAEPIQSEMFNASDAAA